MRQNGGWDNFKMIEVEKYPCNDKREAEAREEELRIELKANMNSHRCFTTIEQKKAYYNDNKEKILDKAKEYYNDNKEKIKEYYNDNKEKIKEYYNDNKDKLKEKFKEYTKANKDKLKQKFICPCGGRYTYCDKAKHSRTKKHLTFLESQINNII